jgi:hypothetical protein
MMKGTTVFALAILQILRPAEVTFAFQQNANGHFQKPTNPNLSERQTPRISESVKYQLTTSPLFSADLCSSEGGKNEPPLGKRDVALSKLRTFASRATLLKLKLVSFLWKLIQNSKVKAVTMSMVYLLLLGNVAKDTFKHTFHKEPSSNAIPIEIPYSHFMDFCEGSGKMTYIDQVQASKEKIEYRIWKAETRSQYALMKQLKNGETLDAGKLSEIPKTNAYTHIVEVNSEMVQLMRNNKIPFNVKAAATTSTTMDANQLLTTAATGFFAYRMFQNNGPSASSKNGPGKRAKQKASAPIVSFDDIEGIDDAKHDVMELVVRDEAYFPGKFTLKNDDLLTLCSFIRLGHTEKSRKV